MKKADIPVPAPCDEDWSAMTGDRARRYCDRCEHHVHDLSEMTEPQARSLLSTRGKQGRLCVRYAADRSGAVRFRRAAPRAAAAAVAVALMSAPASAALELAETSEVTEDSGLLGRLRARVQRWLRPEAPEAELADAEEETEAEAEAEAEEAETEAAEEEEELYPEHTFTAGIYIDPSD